MKAFITSVLSISLLCLGVATAHSDEPPEPAVVDAAQIEKWIAELNSDHYNVRQRATDLLADAGGVVLEPLGKALPGSNLEVISRGVNILRELALSENATTADDARDVLIQLTKRRGTVLASRAQGTLNGLDSIREARAVKALKERGARISYVSQNVIGAPESTMASLQFDDNWTGKDEDLQHVKWLSNVQQVVLTGKKVNNAVVRSIGGLDSVREVSIKRAAITDEAMDAFQSMKKLDQLNVWYTPVSDKAVDELKKLKSLSAMRLYGTRISNQGRDQLTAALPTVNVDYRRGAFLGVGCQAVANGCQITIVNPGSAADKAGIVRDDILTMYGGKKVDSFEKLTELISEHAPGEPVTIELLRNGQVLKKTLKLGSWE